MASTSHTGVALNVKRIAIVGAGPSGLILAKFLVAENCFETIDVYEMRSEVGGIWNYTPQILSEPVKFPRIDPHVSLDKPISKSNKGQLVFQSPAYDRLITNIPKSVMDLSDHKFSSESPLFPSRETVREFWVDYSQNIRHHIRLGTQVQDICLDQELGRDRWTLKVKDLITGHQQEAWYDAVVVANGHFNVPYIPDIPGIEAWNSTYPGAIAHSRDYKSPEAYRGKKVCLVGSGPSSADIGQQIASVSASPVILSARSEASRLVTMPVQEMPPIRDFVVENRTLCFEDGRIETAVDAILFCTGYLYSYPFLESLNPPIVTDGLRVRGLYKQIFLTEHPTLVFPGLSKRVSPFPFVEAQAEVIARVWSGRLVLPSKPYMEEEEQNMLAERGSGMSFHILGPLEVEYTHDLHEWASQAQPGGIGKSPIIWDEKTRWIRTNFQAIRTAYTERKSEVSTPEELGFDFDVYKREEEKKEKLL